MTRFDEKAFSRTLKVKRAERGWTQADMAEASGLSEASIAGYEIGRTIPAFDTVVRIADACGCSVADFAGEEEGA